jgi:predicted enzyme related to lactoylglutathione lyase
VDRALAAGARPVDVGQGDVPWVVLGDPEGNEFCVLEHRAVYADSGRVASIVMDTPDPAALAPFWAAATGWEVVRAEPGFASLRAPDGRGPWLELLRTNDVKVGKNRVHLDVRRADGLLDRLLALGAAHVDVGQGDVPWVVLEDPQGNEFCIL